MEKYDEVNDSSVDNGNQIESDREENANHYEIGNKISVFFLPGTGTGIISGVCDKVSDNGYPIFEVLDENGETHEICETLFDTEEDIKFREQNSERMTTESENSMLKDNFDINKIRQENEEEISRIIEFLNLEISEDTIIQLRNCCKLQAYMVETNNYDSSIMEEKENYSNESIADIDLHNALIKKNGVCTSNSLMFQSVLSKLGISVECVGLEVKPEGFHMANIVFLNGQWYFFDTTLEQSIRQDNLDKDLVLCCAGLGRQEYCPYYTPQCIVRRDGISEIPENISEERIPFQVVNSLFSPITVGEKSM